ncbi:RNA polymerase sigma factor [Sphingobacterium wenxiniae]|nr:sigma-70 family RNA polymerase sigma factor [Sphingobacterium wenxiniae]
MFTSLWKRRQEIKIEDSFYPYLFQSARYEVIDWMVKKQKSIKQASKLVEMSKMSFVTWSSEEHLIAKELSQLIDQEVDRMPPTMRNVFTMSRNQAMTIKDISLELSLSEQTVKNNISLALNKLKSKFK